MTPKEAARAVLLESVNALGAMRDEIVIIGGWVPDLLYPTRHHMGSLDVDLAVSPKALGENAYSTIRERLTSLGYTMHDNPTRFYKQIDPLGEPIKVDLITGQYVTGTKSEAVRVDELRINSLRGVDLAFQSTELVQIEGVMPDGSRNVVTAQLVRPEAYILLKAIALEERTKDKDAYDIAFVLKYYEPSLPELAQRVYAIARGGIGAEALGIFRSKFRTIDSVGPVWAGKAAETAGLDRQLFQRAAFEDAFELFAALDRFRSA